MTTQKALRPASLIQRVELPSSAGNWRRKTGPVKSGGRHHKGHKLSLFVPPGLGTRDPQGGL